MSAFNPPPTRVPAGFQSDQGIRGYISELNNFLQLVYRRITSPYALYTASGDHTTAGNEVVVATAASTVTLNPAPVDREYVLVKRNGAGTVTIAGNGNNIDGATTQTLTTNYEFFGLLYSGTEWLIVSQ